MEIRKLLELGYRIRIDPNSPKTRDFAPSVFGQGPDGVIWSMAQGIGRLPRPDMTLEELQDHLMTMLSEGFKVTVYA